MQPIELFDQCVRAQHLSGDNAKIVVKMTGKWPKGRDTKRLCPGGPIGRIVADDRPSGLIVMFDAAEVMGYLVKKVVIDQAVQP